MERRPAARAPKPLNDRRYVLGFPGAKAMTENNYATIQAPSKKRIIKATAVALLVAAAVLFTAVLPAEYGIDLLGTGKALGLIDLANATAAKPATLSRAIPRRPIIARFIGDRT